MLVFYREVIEKIWPSLFVFGIGHLFTAVVEIITDMTTSDSELQWFWTAGLAPVHAVSLVFTDEVMKHGGKHNTSVFFFREYFSF